MGWVDKVPRAGNLYIGGLWAMHQPGEMAAANVTHVLSVINYGLDAELFRPFVHLAIAAEDDEDENLLQHFALSNAFIDEGLEGGGGVFVHCAMGKSRSATLVVAHLMHKYRLSRDDALAQLCEGRPVAGPNDGFMQQLAVYQQMLEARDDRVEAQAIYHRWLSGRPSMSGLLAQAIAGLGWDASGSPLE